MPSVPPSNPEYERAVRQQHVEQLEERGAHKDDIADAKAALEEAEQHVKRHERHRRKHVHVNVRGD